MASGEYRGEHLRAGPGKALSGARLGVGAFRLSSRLGWQIVSRLRSCPLRGVRATSKRRRPVTRSPPNLPTGGELGEVGRRAAAVKTRAGTERGTSAPRASFPF